MFGVNLEVGLRGEAEGVDAVAYPREYDTGKLQRQGGTQFVGVHDRLVAVDGGAGLPFVRAFELEVERGSHAAEVLAREVEDGSRSGLLGAFGRDVQFQLAVVGQVEHGVYPYVEGIFSGSAAGGILEIAELEHVQSCQCFLCIVLPGLRVGFSLTVQETLAQYAVPDAGLLAGIVDRKVASFQRVGGLFAVVAGEVDRGVSDVVGAECLFGYALPWYNLHADVAFAHDGVGKKRQKFVSGIVIAVVAQQVYQALAFLIQHGHVEVVAAVYQAFVEVGADQAVGTWTEAFVDEGIDVVGLTHVDIVAQLYGTGIARAVYPVGYLAVEVAVVVQQVGCYLDTGFGIDGGNIYGIGSQLLEYPVAEPFFVPFETVVYP